MSDAPDEATDTYASSAEFHELHMDGVWAGMSGVLAEAFGDLPRDALIVDIGAGSGAGVAVLAEQTSCEIIAIEPSASMRSMLLVRLAALGLTDRVTVIPAGVPAAFEQVDGPVDGVVAGHMLGHLTDDQRRGVFEWIDERLVDDGVALLTVSGPGAPDPDAVHIDERRVGRHVYRASHRSPDATTFASLFEVLADDVVLRSREVTGHWARITAADVQAALADRELVAIEQRPGLIVLHRDRGVSDRSLRP